MPKTWHRSYAQTVFDGEFVAGTYYVEAGRVVRFPGDERRVSECVEIHVTGARYVHEFRDGSKRECKREEYGALGRAGAEKPRWQ